MTTTYSEELRPPKELFSRKWFDASNLLDLLGGRTAHIYETKKKLEDLETKLRKNIWKSGGYEQDLLVDTVTLLNTYIGVWNVRLSRRWEINMLHPHNSKIMSTWNETVLGEMQRFGVCLCMLSPECVEWLNRISDWVRE